MMLVEMVGGGKLHIDGGTSKPHYRLYGISNREKGKYGKRNSKAINTA